MAVLDKQTLLQFLQFTVFSLLLKETFTIKIRGSYILLDHEKEDLLYFLESEQKWDMCTTNSTPVDLYKYFKNGYINDACYKANLKKSSPKNAWFYSMTPNTVYPTCDSRQFGKGDNFIWKCENDLSPLTVTPYRNCSLFCKLKDDNISTDVRVRCGINLEWNWFGKEVNPNGYCQQVEVKDSSTGLHIVLVAVCSSIIGIGIAITSVLLWCKRYKAYSKQYGLVSSGGSSDLNSKSEETDISYQVNTIGVDIPPNFDETSTETSILNQREISHGDSAEDFDTLEENPVSYNGSFEEHQHLEANPLNECLDNFPALSINSLNREPESGPLYSGMIQGTRQQGIGSDSGRAEIGLMFSDVDLSSAPKLSSEMYSSENSRKNRNRSTVTQRNDARINDEYNYQGTYLDLTQCNLLISEAIENGNLAFFEKLACYLDPDREYGKSKSWYGLTLSVLKLPLDKVKLIRHHYMGNVESGHFMNTLEFYTAKGMHLSDIVNYFVQTDTQRSDVIQLFKSFHSNCPICSRLYSKINL